MSLETGRRVLEIEARAISDLVGRLDRQFEEGVETILACRGRLLLLGMAKSGLVGQKISATVSSTGTPSFFLHPAEALLGALGRLAPSYYTQDGVVPRTRLPDILREITAIGAKYNLAIGNVFHAGDGNIHPIVLYDEREPGQVQRAIDAGRDILAACVAMGGSLTGEHGIGVEKQGEMPLLFSPDDMLAMAELRRVFDPKEPSNPNKVIPRPGECVEVAAPHRQVPV